MSEENTEDLSEGPEECLYCPRTAGENGLCGPCSPVDTTEEPTTFAMVRIGSAEEASILELGWEGDGYPDGAEGWQIYRPKPQWSLQVPGVGGFEWSGPWTDGRLVVDGIPLLNTNRFTTKVDEYLRSLMGYEEMSKTVIRELKERAEEAEAKVAKLEEVPEHRATWHVADPTQMPPLPCLVGYQSGEADEWRPGVDDFDADDWVAACEDKNPVVKWRPLTKRLSSPVAPMSEAEALNLDDGWQEAKADEPPPKLPILVRWSDDMEERWDEPGHIEPRPWDGACNVGPAFVTHWKQL